VRGGRALEPASNAADAAGGGPLAVGQSRAAAILAAADKRLRGEALEGEPPPPPFAATKEGAKAAAAPQPAGSTDSVGIGSPAEPAGDDGGSVREPGSPGRGSPVRSGDERGGRRERERSRHRERSDGEKRREGRSRRRERSGGGGGGGGGGERSHSRSRTRSESPTRGGGGDGGVPSVAAPLRAASPPFGRISPPAPGGYGPGGGRISPPAAPGGGGRGYAPAGLAPMPAPLAPRFFAAPAQGLNLGAAARPRGPFFAGAMGAFPRAAPGLGPTLRGYGNGGGGLLQPFPAPRLLGQMGAAIMASPTSPVSMVGAGAAVAARGGWGSPRMLPRTLPPLGPARGYPPGSPGTVPRDTF